MPSLPSSSAQSSATREGLQYQALPHWSDQHQQALIEQLIELCNINSGSWHIDGIRRVQQQLDAIFRPLSDTVEYRPLPAIEVVADDGTLTTVATADMQIFRARPEAPLQLLMTGHSDTVFAADSDFQHCRLLTVDGETRLHGPGTADMKGGLLIIAQALQALEQTPLKQQFGFILAISPDEEIGSPVSAPELMKLAHQADIGLTYEPALADGTLAGARKGSGNFTLTASGKSSHAGRDFFHGKNAVAAIAEAASRLSQLSDEATGISVNIGSIHGGGAVNIVPERCVCRFNVRMHDQQQMNTLQQQIHQVINQVEQLSGCSLRLHGHFNRPPKPMNSAHQQLFQWLHECGSELGLELRWQATGGCCEGNNLAAAGLANIDTLGVRGAHIHTAQEYVCIDSLAERTALTIRFIERLIHEQQHNQLAALKMENNQQQARKC